MHIKNKESVLIGGSISSTGNQEDEETLNLQERDEITSCTAMGGVSGNPVIAMHPLLRK